jgi:hypothetical protein
MRQRDKNMKRLSGLATFSTLPLLLIVAACVPSVRASELARHYLGSTDAPVTVVGVSDFG